MCSYCGCESVTVVGRFMAEHVDIINANGDLRRACSGADAAVTSRAVERLRNLLRPHTSAEEAGMFAVLAEDPEVTEHVRSLCAEHATLDVMLDEIAEGRTATMPVFERALRVHIDREENGLFPTAAIAFAGPEWDHVVALTPPATTAEPL